jgi:hypothetical protein
MKLEIRKEISKIDASLIFCIYQNESCIAVKDNQIEAEKYFNDYKEAFEKNSGLPEIIRSEEI